MQYPHLWLGALCIFVYVGVEVMAGDAIGTYGHSFGLPLDKTKFFTSFTLFAMLLGYVVGLLAILKAGAAYVPLDPDYPAQRLAYMLEDARPRMLLSQAWLLPLWPPDDARDTLALDTDWHAVEACAATALDATG